MLTHRSSHIYKMCLVLMALLVYYRPILSDVVVLFVFNRFPFSPLLSMSHSYCSSLLLLSLILSLPSLSTIYFHFPNSLIIFFIFTISSSGCTTFLSISSKYPPPMTKSSLSFRFLWRSGPIHVILAGIPLLAKLWGRNLHYQIYEESQIPFLWYAMVALTWAVQSMCKQSNYYSLGKMALFTIYM